MAEPDTTEQPENGGTLPPLPGDRLWARTWQGPFLRALSVLPDVSSACRIARISRATVYTTRGADPDFAEAWAEALELSRDFVQRQAHTWITTGVPVRSTRTVTRTKTDSAGNVIETTTETTATESAERSATLMIFWLKAHYPERYRWAEKIEGPGEGGAIVVQSVASVDAQIAKLTAELAAVAGDAPVPVE